MSEHRHDKQDDQPRTGSQDEPDASSDGDRSWTEDPITADPDEDRSVRTVVERGSDDA